ncbi:hypothetical protein DFJ74DRAFT_647022 [Hyaloraphidium curvatum]|nr:hypothetical protein DFJ74DRAFT_647022 [Hyaloraphidium curvatum]
MCKRCALPREPELTAASWQAVKFFADGGIDFTVAGGRHTMRCFKDGAPAIDLRLLSNVFVDPKAGVARAGGGATVHHLDAECAAHGSMYTTAGTNRTTGIGGFGTGGGYGTLARRLGMFVDNVVACEIVTADGRLHVCTAEDEPDLLWAVLGAGANFGIVTGFTVKLHPVDVVYGGMHLRPFVPAPARGLLDAFDGYLHGPSPAARESSPIMAFGWAPGPDGNLAQVTVVLHHYIGGEGKTVEDAKRETKALVEDYKDPLPLLVDAVGEMPYLELQNLTAPFNPPGNYVEKAIWTDGPMPDDLKSALLDGFAASPPGVNFLIAPTGGAIADRPKDATAFPNRFSGYWIIALSVFPDDAGYGKILDWWVAGAVPPSAMPDLRAARHGRYLAHWDKIAAHKSGSFMNEIGSWWNSEAAAGAEAKLMNTKKDYFGPNLARLVEVKKKAGRSACRAVRSLTTPNPSLITADD